MHHVPQVESIVFLQVLEDLEDELIWENVQERFLSKMH